MFKNFHLAEGLLRKCIGKSGILADNSSDRKSKGSASAGVHIRNGGTAVYGKHKANVIGIFVDF